MKQKFFELQLKTNGQKLYNFTDQTVNWIKKNSFSRNILIPVIIYVRDIRQAMNPKD